MDSPHLSELFKQLFANKPEDKRTAWLNILLNEEYETINDLKAASDEVWNTLPLPLAIKDALKQAVKNLQPVPSVVVQHPKIIDTRPIVQVDLIVFDISSSMNSKSWDPLNTRLGLAKTLFHTMVDKYVGLELAHGLGLVLFGTNTQCFPFTRDYETFHDTLGNAAANENSTKLWDSIEIAAQQLIKYREDHKQDLDQNCKFRIFCLTDGSDNASVKPYWQVAYFLQQNNIVLDSIPLATTNNNLQCMAIATGGLCLKVLDAEKGVSLFEREAVISLSQRETPKYPLPAIVNESSLTSLLSQVSAVEDIKQAVPQAVTAKVMTAEAVNQAVQVLEHQAVSNTTTSAAQRRILKEFQEGPTKYCTFYLTENDIFSWKVIMKGPEGTPYEKGTFLIYFNFPTDYPFKPPRLQFITPIYHCNVNSDGKVCLSILRENWSPALTISKVMQTVKELLETPNPLDALDTVKANVYSDNRERYLALATEHCLQHASDSEEELKRKYNF